MTASQRHGRPAGVLLLAALVASYGAYSQPLLDRASNEAQRQIVETIRERQSEDGRNSANLIGPFTALGLHYQESGQHELAAAALERALQLVRVNYGLHSLDQAPLIRQRIENEEARGNVAGAWNLEQALIALSRRHSYDLRIAPILREIGDKRMEVLERYVDGEFPPQIALGCYYGSDNCMSGSRSVVIASVLSEAQRHYSDAIKALIQHDRYSSDELRELEMELVRSSFVYGAVYGDGRDYFIGRDSLRRLGSYEAASSAPPRARIDTLIALADWDLLYSRSADLQASALETYKQAYRELRQLGISQAEIDRIFAPETPVVLPTFLPNFLAPEEAHDSTGYVDVAFEVTKEGKGKRIEILDKAGNARRADERRLNQLILRSRFRPRVVDGEFVDSAPVVARYHLSSDAEAP